LQKTLGPFIAYAVTFGQVGSKRNVKVSSDHLKILYKYAIASSNAYLDKPQIEIDGWKRVKRFEGKLGSGADIYERKGIRKEKVVVIAFRGTEFATWRDWVFGNFNIIYPGQYKEAALLMKQIRHEYGNAITIETTGHSLGGGLALSLARTNPGVNSFVFDSSPRLNSSNRYNNLQVQVVEQGEILTYARALWRIIPPNSFEPVVTYKVNYLKGRALLQHSIDQLAQAMLKDAARVDKGAQKMWADLERRR
jgi:pimeloyl-ACP methyl ester carboxylesterase